MTPSKDYYFTRMGSNERKVDENPEKEFKRMIIRMVRKIKEDCMNT
jgi:hypothetical protein